MNNKNIVVIKQINIILCYSKKITKMTKYLFLLFTVITFSINATDSTLVRVKVDMDSITLNINEQQQAIDYYGNYLIKDTWFMLFLKPGEYDFIFKKNDSLLSDTTVTIVDQEVITLGYLFLAPIIMDSSKADSEITDKKVILTINSDPNSAFVIMNDDSTNQTTPFTVTLPPDSVKIEVYKENYKNLISTMMLELNRKINANFILKTLSPSGVTPESLGLSYLPIQTVRDTLSLKKIANQYKSMSELFFIFPFLQGVILKLVVSDDKQNNADIMILSGAGLSIGTRLLGKIIVKKKRRNILQGNEQLELDNLEALEKNRLLDSIITSKNDELIKDWEKENINRGKVEIIIEDEKSKEE